MGATKKSYLFSTIEEELVGVNAIGNCTSNQGDPMENKGRLLWVLDQELSKYVDNDSECEESGKGESCCSKQRLVRIVAQQVCCIC